MRDDTKATFIQAISINEPSSQIVEAKKILTDIDNTKIDDVSKTRNDQKRIKIDQSRN